MHVCFCAHCGPMFGKGPGDVPVLCVLKHCCLAFGACAFVSGREFEQLREGVVSLWEQLESPPDEIVSFLSECDLIAPYNPRVLDLCVLRPDAMLPLAHPPSHTHTHISGVLGCSPHAGWYPLDTPSHVPSTHALPCTHACAQPLPCAQS